MREVFLGADPIPVGSRVGDLIYVVRISAPDTASGLRDLREIVENAGASLDNVAQVSFFVAGRELLPTINPAWLEVFGDEADRPTYKFMTADLPADRPVALEFFAVAGARRRPLHLPNVAHTNPIPMGVRIGRYLFSSRVLPYDPATGAPPEDAARQAECLFGNIRALLDAGQMPPERITSARLFVSDLAYASLAEPLLRDLRVPVAPHVTHYTLAPALKVMLELIASA
jgi:enamine deaminase RidA (YjgF/YER057c/UK114 family)